MDKRHLEGNEKKFTDSVQQQEALVLVDLVLVDLVLVDLVLD